MTEKLGTIVTRVKPEERVLLDDGYVVILVKQIKQGQVQLNITAPNGVRVRREDATARTFIQK